MTKKSNFFSLVLIAVVLSQILIPNLIVSQQTYTDRPLPMTVLMPRVFTAEPYGVDAVVSVGTFDNYTVSPVGGFCETDICVNPLNPLNFVCTDNRIITGQPYVFYTTNGGVSWGQFNCGGNAGDPAFTADSMGNFYMATLNNSVNGFIIFKSTNGGVSWTSSSVPAGGGITSIDKEWIAADQTNGPFKNNLYMAFYNTSGNAVGFERSTNNGVSWTLVSANIGTFSANPGPDVAVDANGKVYVAWDNGGGTSVRTSTDGGLTFSATVTANFHSEPGTVQFGRYCLKQAIRVNAMPHIAIDLTNGPNKNNVYCLFPTNPPGPDQADIYMTRSTDGGATWNSGTPVKINDDTTFNDQWQGDVSVDAQGRVWASWWDSRNDPANVLTEEYGAVSTDGGVTFSPNFKIGNQNFNPNVIRISQGSGQAYYLGDYQGMSGKTFTFPCYTGQNNGYLDYVAYLPDYGMTFSKPSDTVSGSGTSVNSVQIPMMGNYSGTVTYTATVTPDPTPGTIVATFLPSNIKVLTGTPDSVILNCVVSPLVPIGTYTVSVTGTEASGLRTHTRSWSLVVARAIGIHNQGTELPKVYALFQNYPNPFNPSTQIEYALPKQSLVNMKIFDILGREVANPVKNEMKSPGTYQVSFDATNLPSGIYFYKISAGDFSQVKRMILLK